MNSEATVHAHGATGGRERLVRGHEGAGRTDADADADADADGTTVRVALTADASRFERELLVGLDAGEAMIADETNQLSALDDLEGEAPLGFLFSTNLSVETVNDTCAYVELEAGADVSTCSWALTDAGPTIARRPPRTACHDARLRWRIVAVGVYRSVTLREWRS